MYLDWDGPAFWPVMSSVVHRWRTASLGMDSTLDLSALVKNSATALVKLILDSAQIHGSRPTTFILDNLLSDDIPRLQSLTLNQVRLRGWGLKVLSGLRRLCIAYVGDNYPPTVDQIRQALQECPKLECLDLIGMLVKNDLGLPQKDVIHLPRLRSLAIDFKPAESLESLPNSIQCSYRNLIDFQGKTKALWFTQILKSLKNTIMLFTLSSFTTAVHNGCLVTLAAYEPAGIIVQPSESTNPDFRLRLPFHIRDLT
ncbi:hypothetical protein FRB95_013155 [Tulasnella sp. JGI-2019a]|nr:hypothetical protein FRB95_013155 [Tulasnella sp. JGI-2019a]